MDQKLERSLGVVTDRTPEAYAARQLRLRRYINLQLIASGLSPVPLEDTTPTSVDAEEMLGAFRERLSLLDDPLCPADRRIERFLHDHFVDLAGEAALRLPERTLTLDHHGVARELSLPVDGDTFRNESGLLLSPPQRRAAQSAERSSHDQRHVPRLRRGAADSGG